LRVASPPQHLALRPFEGRARSRQSCCGQVSLQLASSAGGDSQRKREDAGGASLAQEHGGNGHRPAGIDLIVDKQDGARGGIGLDGGGEAVGHAKRAPE
jgi:hypothetical protein